MKSHHTFLEPRRSARSLNLAFFVSTLPQSFRMSRSVLRQKLQQKRKTRMPQTNSDQQLTAITEMCSAAETKQNEHQKKLRVRSEGQPECSLANLRGHFASHFPGAAQICATALVSKSGLYESPGAHLALLAIRTCQRRQTTNCN